MKKSFLWLTFLVLLSPNVQADTLKGGSAACTSKEHLHELMLAVGKNDERAFTYLLKKGCIIAKPGIEISILDVDWTGKVKIRAYLSDSDSIVLFTNSGSVQRADK